MDVRKKSWAGLVCLFAGCLMSKQHVSVSQGQICLDNCTCCRTEREVVNQTCYLTKSPYTDNGPTSSSSDPIKPGYHLAGQVVTVSVSRVSDPRFRFPLHRDFSGITHSSDLKIGIQVATLPRAWHYRVSIMTGWPSVSILRVAEEKSLICNFSV